jgi:hypothetical protein
MIIEGLDFMDSPYFDRKTFTLNEDAPEDVKKQFEDYMRKFEEADKEEIDL